MIGLPSNDIKSVHLGEWREGHKDGKILTTVSVDKRVTGGGEQPESRLGI